MEDPAFYRPVAIHGLFIFYREAFPLGRNDLPRHLLISCKLPPAKLVVCL